MASDVSKRLWATVLLVFLFGCDEKEESKEDPCRDTAQLDLEEISGADLVGTVTYEEMIKIDDGGKQSKSTVLSADFADLSDYDIVTKATPFEHSCVGILGRPTTTGEPVLLTVESINIESSHIGKTAIEKDANDTYYTGYDGNFYTKAGGEEITADVTSSGDETMFPGFRESVSAPSALENYSAAVSDIGTLVVEWASGESTYLEVILRSIAESDDDLENRVRCYFLADDGCFEVPYLAMEWLKSGGAHRVKVRMERHMSKISTPAQNAIVEIDAVRSIEFNINI